MLIAKIISAYKSTLLIWTCCINFFKAWKKNYTEVQKTKQISILSCWWTRQILSNLDAIFNTKPLYPPKRPPFYFLITIKNYPILIIFGMLNPEEIWHKHLTDLSTSPVRCSHFFLGSPKKSFLTVLFLYFRLFTLSQKKTNSNCCTAAFAVYLLLFTASYYLHSLSTASGAR